MQMVERAIVWSGGAMFAGSLVLCSVLYVVVFDRERPPYGWQPIVIDIALFGLFAAHHSVFARGHVKRTIGAVIPRHLLRSSYVWTASLLLVVVCVWWRPIGGELYHAQGVPAFLHAVVQLAGLCLSAWSVAKIDALELAGIRQPAGNGQVHVGGPYKFVRHPLYLGWILAVCGAARMTGDRLVFALITSTYLLIAIPWEERALSRDFGDAYAKYKLTVRWRVLPFIY
jgi:methanethiol S-methyltransferase